MAANNAVLEEPPTCSEGAPDDLRDDLYPIFPASPLPTAPRALDLASLTPFVSDERAISGLLELIFRRSGLSAAAVARRLGLGYNGVAQYVRGRRANPSLRVFARIVEACGGRIYIELPPRR